MKRSYEEIMTELKNRINDVMVKVNMINRYELTVIIPRKELKIIENVNQLIIKSYVGESEKMTILGLNLVPADVGRIYICLE